MTSRIGKPDTDSDIELRDRLSANGSRHFVMVAGAGSGKTTSLVKALSYLEQDQGPALRRKGQKIACITFTEVAVNEIRSDVGTDQLYHVSTIHSFLWENIKPFQYNIKEWVSRHLNDKVTEAQAKIDNPKTRQATKDSAAEDIARYQHQLEQINSVESFRYGTGSDYINGILGHSDILKIGPLFIREHPLMRRVLSRRYPVIFVDESQDTNPGFVEALRIVANENQNGFCVGFFGDPVQKIYMQGAGSIAVDEGWQMLEKPENFRCPQSVLRLINRIRAEDDGLEQTRGRHEKLNGEDVPIEGTARVLIMLDDDQRQERLEAARSWLAERDGDDSWLADDSEEVLRLLVLVHRISAITLGFPNLYSALNDKSTESLSSGVVDGTAWVLRPFLTFILPLLLAHRENRHFEIMRLLRKYCPKLQTDGLAGANTSDVLNELQEDILTLDVMLGAESRGHIGDVVKLLRERRMYTLDDRYLQLVENFNGAEPVADPAPENAALRFMQCEATELWGYRRYIEKLSPFATQQGIKGAEFDKVLVVVDDKERQLPGYSYGKYFGVTPLSETDENNIASETDSVIDRTRRLFYVCCSRALSDLVVAVFTDDPGNMQRAIVARGLFEPDNIYLLD
ncbi:UvrD-helicase domain-containing protein [Nitrincola alkalilacustris]|uniref:UvrD-helicase domain-containing protein n=1 Tax=Nitrincola alkalilacustris TaxID=1571224 RepID=UPI00124E4247|nr:UvrD-helicase domain-containing protein [Nitrincola alkalilacustris]